MSKTIKQIADELGVSKTAIRKRFTAEFKSQYVETNADGSLQVSDEGCKLISESLRKQAQTPQTKFAETGENHGFQSVASIQKETIELLTTQLASKDEQIRAQQEQIRTLQAQLTAKDEQIGQITAAMESTAAALTAAQALHAADKKTLMLIEDKENERKLSFWERRAAKKAEKKARKEDNNG